MKRIDPYKREEQYKRWKNESGGRIQNVSDADARLIEQYLRDMELGLNVSRASKRGPRSFTRLNDGRSLLLGAEVLAISDAIPGGRSTQWARDVTLAA